MLIFCSIAVMFFWTDCIEYIRARKHMHAGNRILCVWKGDKMVGRASHEVVSAGLAIYGPRTAIPLAINGVEGEHEGLLIDDFGVKHGSWVHTAVFSTVIEGNVFAP